MTQKLLTIFASILFLYATASGQNSILSGSVKGNNKENESEPLFNANIWWFGISNGTTSDENGSFEIIKPADEDLFLVVSYIGYTNDTVLIRKGQATIDVSLQMNGLMDEVLIEGSAGSTYIPRMNPQQSQIVTTKGMQKLACCNLSESFENNATVDVAYSDALSGAKQIMMLGLAGVYSQLFTENIPSVRGLATSHGLGYIPGAWMESIQISKGTASVINGYESTTGQINVELKKPNTSERLHVNLYGNHLGKAEGNINSAFRLGKKLSVMLLLHGEDFRNVVDLNSDSFLDLPKTSQVNLYHSWRYENEGKLVVQAGIKVLKENRRGGQTFFDKEKDYNTDNAYGVGIQTDRNEVFVKAGIPFPNKPENSLGIHFSAISHQQKSFFGYRVYNGNQIGVYSNLIYQTIIKNTNHKLSTGLSYIFDNYDEYLGFKSSDTTFARQESVPGFFTQYTFTPSEKITLMAGLRADMHNIHGLFVTPRIHAKYSFTENMVLKASAGKGYRQANVLIENIAYMASSKAFVISEKLNAEEAWNYGISLTRYFLLNNKDATFSIDFYRTDFVNQIIADIDQNAEQVIFYNLKGRSWANSFQAEIIMEPFKRFEVDAAFRFNDTWVTIADQLVQKPLVNRYKAMLGLSWATKYDKMKFDITSQFNGKTRLPDSYPLLSEYSDGFAPAHIILHAQITKRFKFWDVYVGGENLSNFVQTVPVLSANDPFSSSFDASMVWGPVVGRIIYAGVRITVK